MLRLTLNVSNKGPFMRHLLQRLLLCICYAFLSDMEMQYTMHIDQKHELVFGRLVIYKLFYRCKMLGKFEQMLTILPSELLSCLNIDSCIRSKVCVVIKIIWWYVSVLQIPFLHVIYTSKYIHVSIFTQIPCILDDVIHVHVCTSYN